MALDVSKLKLPWTVEWKDGDEGRKEASLPLDVDLSDNYKVTYISLFTDVYGDGSDTLGIEYSITSPEEHSVAGDDSLAYWESEQQNYILEHNPDLGEGWGEWDRERGEEEWTSKLVITHK